MKTKDALLSALKLNRSVLNAYISDLNDSDLLVRVIPETKHIAWQLGHLINTENELAEFIKPGISPVLSADFKAKHAKDKSESNLSKDYETKETYLALLENQRQATLLILEGLSDSDLDNPGPTHLKSMTPTIGTLFSLIAGHDLMHAGQFVAVRRKLGKPVLI